MSVLVYGVKGTVDGKSLFYLLKKSPIPTLNLPSFPPSLGALPIPSLPSFPTPSFSLNFNPPKYNLDFGNGNGTGGGLGKLPTLPKLPSLGLNLPSFPPSLGALPIPSLPSFPTPSFSLNFNKPKYALGLSSLGKSLSVPKLPSLGLNLPSFPPSLGALPIPSLPKVPSADMSLFSPYFNMKFPYLNVQVPEINITTILRTE